MVSDYKGMWEDYASHKAEGYYKSKFVPLTRIGLTNYLREMYILKYLPLHKEYIGVDLGCASGKQVFEMAKRIKFCYGVDIAENFIDFAKQKAKAEDIKNVDFRTSPLENLPFKDKTFDIVLCSEVLEHVEDLPKSLREIKRICKEGAKVVITVPNLNSDGTVWGRIMRALRLRKFTPFNDFSPEGIKNHKDTHVREFDIKKIKTVLKKNGFKINKVTTVSMIDFFDAPIDFMLKVRPLRKIMISIEKYLSNRKIPLGRHIVILAEKKRV